MRKIILASTSPRRRELLAQTELEFEVLDSGYEEDLSVSTDPEELVRFLALGKARAAAELEPEAIIIAADQVIACNDQIFGKPHNTDRQRAMLQSLSNQSHDVITAYVILDAMSGKCLCEVEKSRVRFKYLSNMHIDEYIQTNEGLDRAGGYAIQGLGKDLVESIEGDYMNIVGLPLSRVVTSLQEFGVAVPKTSGN